MDAATETSVVEPTERGAPVRRRLTILASGTVMALLMLAGVFSIGVWVGAGRPDSAATFGFGGGGPRGGGNGGAPPGGVGGAQPPGGQPQGGAATFSALSRPADIIGQVGSLNGDTLTVNSQTGARVVTLTASTKIMLSDGTAGSRADLQQGRVVGIVGTAANGGLSFTAEEVAVASG
jgi:hypothetical protein